MKTTTNNRVQFGTFVAFLTLFGTSCTSQMSQSVTDETAGLNGGFEHVKEGLPVNWLCYPPKLPATENLAFTQT